MRLNPVPSTVWHTLRSFLSDAKGTRHFQHPAEAMSRCTTNLLKYPPMKKPLTLTWVALVLTASSGFSAVVFTENFSYPDGPLVGAAGSPWVTHSGTTPLQVNVASGAAELVSTESEDVSAPFAPTGFFYNSGTLTATFSATFSALPNLTGAYFAHFKDAASGFRGRVFATTTGAATGFRLGISDATNAVASAVFIPTDLSLSTTYLLTLTLDAATGRSSLAIAGIGSATATDGAPLTAINAREFALRQGGTHGTVAIDNLSIDATGVAVPETSTAVLGLLAGLGLLRRRR